MDVAAITGLCPHGIILSSAFSAEGMDDFALGLDPKTNLAYGRLAKIFTSCGAEPVSKDKHIAFLWCWLCYSLFYTRSQQINRDFLLIAVALANGQKLALGPYFLAFLYQELFEAIMSRPVPRHVNRSAVCTKTAVQTKRLPAKISKL